MIEQQMDQRINHQVYEENGRLLKEAYEGTGLLKTIAVNIATVAPAVSITACHHLSPSSPSPPPPHFINTNRIWLNSKGYCYCWNSGRWDRQGDIWGEVELSWGPSHHVAWTALDTFLFT